MRQATKEGRRRIPSPSLSNRAQLPGCTASVGSGLGFALGGNFGLALGDGIKRVSDDELAKRKKFRRTIATARTLKVGEEIRYEDILFKRPGTGIPADKYKEIIGRHVCRDIDANKTLLWEDLVR